MAFPFVSSIAVVIMILDDQKLTRTLAYTQVSLGALIIVIVLVSIDVIILDNYISNNITYKSWLKFYENL
jgi:hypothetical protein